jgi:transposase-like protein
MSKKRRQYSAEFKFKVAMEAAKETKTLSALASEKEIHPNQISQWKRQLLEEGASLFGSTTPSPQQQEAAQAELYEQIGRLKMELEWLKKKVARNG